MRKGYDSKKPSKKTSKTVKKGYVKDLGKKNVPGKTGFKAVASNAAADYGSQEAGERVAGAMLKKMKVAKKV